MRLSAASTVVPGDTNWTSRVMTREIGVAFGSRPAATTRMSKSRSVKMPPTRPSSVTMRTAPTSRWLMTATASATDADAAMEISSSLALSRTTASTSSCMGLSSRVARRRPSSAEVVQHDVLALHPEREQHVDHGPRHRARSAQVVLDVLRRRVVLQVPVVQHLMDESDRSGPAVLRERLREREMPLEVGVVGLQRIEFLSVEGFQPAARAVPERHLALRAEAMELVEDVRAHRRHARAAADEAHLLVRLACEELPVRSGHGHLVARLQGEDPGTHDPGRDVLAILRREADADREQQDALFARMVRHRVRPRQRRGRLRPEAPEVEAVPRGAERRVDVEVPEREPVRGALDLHVAPCAERHLLALGQRELELLDERRDVPVRDHAAAPLANAEHFGRKLDPQVALDLHLAREPTAALRLAERDEAGLGRQQLAAAFPDDHLAHAARALAAAGRGNEDPAVGERAEQRPAGAHPQRLRRAVVDISNDSFRVLP